MFKSDPPLDERLPLLRQKRDDQPRLSWTAELIALWKLILPIYASNILEFSQGAFSVIIVGRLGTHELAAMGIAVDLADHLRTTEF